MVFKETHTANENTQKVVYLVGGRANIISLGGDVLFVISHRIHAKVIYSWRADLRVNLDLGAFFVQFLLVKFLLQINALYGFNELRLHTRSVRVCADGVYSVPHAEICEVYRWRAPLHLRFENKLKRINKFMNNVYVYACVCARCVYGMCIYYQY